MERKRPVVNVRRPLERHAARGKNTHADALIEHTCSMTQCAITMSQASHAPALADGDQRHLLPLTSLSESNTCMLSARARPTVMVGGL